MAKRVVLELSSSTNFVYSLNPRLYRRGFSLSYNTYFGYAVHSFQFVKRFF